MDGQLEQVAGGWQLRLVRLLPHPPARVWRALTDPGELAAWFPAVIEGEREPGAALRFVFRGDEGTPRGGEMLAYDPPFALELGWGEETLGIELRPHEAGCVVMLVNTFGDAGSVARDPAGWHATLDLLGYHLAGDQARRQHVQPAYSARFGDNR